MGPEELSPKQFNPGEFSPQEFSEEQKQYLQGLASGIEIARATRASSPASGRPAPAGPDAIHLQAQDRFVIAGRKLASEEQAKRAKHPFDMWDEMRANAAAGRFPKGSDVFLYKFHGLFYVAPAQDAFMCRLRIPNGILKAYQLRGLADVAAACGGGYADITTRANLQIREIPAQQALKLLQGVQALGLSARGAGADNIRNITGSPTAGIDPQELIDTRPLCAEMHDYILNHRFLYGLPRKFNIAFDGGGSVGVLEDTNDIGFAAVRVPAGKAVAPGVYFRMQLGGITGHGDFARDTGVLLTPEECVPVAAAALRVYIEHGDRTDRKRARLKYLLEAWGLEKYLMEIERSLQRPLPRFPLGDCLPRAGLKRDAHVGVHAQSQPDRCYVGVAVPVGRLSADQMRGLAALSERYGSGTLRLTVWQNLLISDLAPADLPAVEQGLQELGLTWRASPVRAGLVACTGNGGCRFAAADTKRHALRIAERVEDALALDQPLNIHLTGCHHSCAQHYIGDIGLLATKVAQGDADVEGYHVYVGGGYGEARGIGRELFRAVPAQDLPALVTRMLAAYQAHRAPAESFAAFTRRHDIDDLRELFQAQEELAHA